MATLLDCETPVQSDPYLASLLSAWEPRDDEPLPEPDPPWEPTLPLDEWIYTQSAMFRSPTKLGEAPLHEDELTMELVADALQDLALGCRFHRCLTPTDYVGRGAMGGIIGDLARVRIPDRRASLLAELLDTEAQPYMDLGTDVGRLCAAAILIVAEDAEQLGARSVVDYWRKCDQRDAERRDAMAAMMSYE